MPRRENATHTMAFEVWYTLKKNVAETLDALARQDPPIRIHHATIYRWMKTYGWDKRAQEREIAVAKKMSEQSIAEQVGFRKRQLTVGRVLQQKGMEFLNTEKSITNEFAALQAVKLGQEMESSALGIRDGDQMTIGDLTIRIVRDDTEFGRVDPRDVVDGETTEQKHQIKNLPAPASEKLPEKESDDGHTGDSPPAEASPEAAGDTGQHGQA